MAPLTRNLIRRDNLAYAGTGGVSPVSRQRRFEPAFCDESTGQVELARYGNGAIAPMHLLDGLPSHWVLERDGAGRPCALRPTIVAGFVRDGRFFTREQAANDVV
jgi:hypothetical protein